MHGFLNINKQQGVTSFDVIRRLKPLLPRRHKAGHMGTLDPMAAGVLPIALGQASKMLHYIEDQSKEYTTTLLLGAVSDTQDIWGQVEATGTISFSMAELKKIVAGFTGSIEQIPPMFSAVHHQGRRLYELAREGITVERQPRTVFFSQLEIISVEDTRPFPSVQLAVACSRGAYVRTLCHDIGAALGTGAVMSALQRTRSGPFHIQHSLSLEEIIQGEKNLGQYLLPLDYPLQDLPGVELAAGQEQAFRQGQRIRRDELKDPGRVRVYDHYHTFLGIARWEKTGQGGEIQPLRLIT